MARLECSEAGGHVVVQRVSDDGDRVLGFARMSLDAFDEFVEQAVALRDRLHGLSRVEPWPDEDEMIELGGPVASPAEPIPDDCLPSIVRVADDRGHIDLSFRRED